MKITPGKLAGLKAVSNARNVIAAAAMDQRGSLQKSLAKERGATADGHDLEVFKTLVTEVLTGYASAILLDPRVRSPRCPASQRQGPSSCLRKNWLRCPHSRTLARSARQLERPPPRQSRCRLHQNPALLHAL